MAKWSNKKVKTRPVKRSPVANAAGRTRSTPEAGERPANPTAGAARPVMWRMMSFAWTERMLVLQAAVVLAVWLGVEPEQAQAFVEAWLDLMP